VRVGGPQGGLTIYADPHQTLWVLDLPWWERPREFLTPHQQLRLDIGRMRAAGYTIVVKRRPHQRKRPKQPRVTDLWYARKRRGEKLIPSGAMNQIIAYKLWLSQGGVCGYCERPTYVPNFRSKARPNALKADIDHRDPVSQGGTWKRYNLMSACETCNRAKGDLDEVTFRAILEQFPPEPSGHFIAQVKAHASREIGRRVRERNAARQGRSAASPTLSPARIESVVVP
jgi:5-methylcytosine-specific restriction endonuclease McrA